MQKHYYRHRHYKNAVPHCEFIEHAPTEAQMDALQKAKSLAQKDARKNGQYGWGNAPVLDGSGCYARVQWSPGHSTSCIWFNNPASSGGMCQIKLWQGVPEWDDAPPAQHSPGEQIHNQTPTAHVEVAPSEVRLHESDRVITHAVAPKQPGFFAALLAPSSTAQYRGKLQTEPTSSAPSLLPPVAGALPRPSPLAIQHQPAAPNISAPRKRSTLLRLIMGR